MMGDQDTSLARSSDSEMFTNGELYIIDNNVVVRSRSQMTWSRR